MTEPRILYSWNRYSGEDGLSPLDLKYFFGVKLDLRRWLVGVEVYGSARGGRFVLVSIGPVVFEFYF